MELLVIAVFLFVYLGMAAGGVPGLAIDRSGVALLGAIALLAGGAVTAESAWASVDVSTIGLLFGLMVVSAQFRLGGFYTLLSRRIASLDGPPGLLLGLVIGSSAVLSALLANDIVCLAMTPVLIEGCVKRKLDPVPHLLGLACAANVGSAATLIGNPQNMLIGQVLGLSFGGYLADALPVAVAGLFAVWLVIALMFRGRWERSMDAPPAESPPYDRWQTGKGFFVLAVLIAVFLWGGIPREAAALAGAGVLLLSRRLASRSIFGLIDWPLLLLFFGLFVVNDSLSKAGITEWAFHALSITGLDLDRWPVLFGLTAVLSNIVSNVPAVMLLLPQCQTPESGLVLALSSTLAGNLILTGSIANLIVAEWAAVMGVRITWLSHAVVGVPVTILTLALAAGWLWLG
ncbi:MAG: anion transporter [Deltaproteobacteria bacterium]|nr:anion transporter [Deltaproteobacteria bacterium]